MADRVIIIDAHRAGQNVPIYELKQMMGRVSRGGDIKPGHVDFIVGVTKNNSVQDDILNSPKYKIESTIGNNIEELCFHIMAEISRGVIKTKDDILNWYKRSLHAFQNGTLNIDEIIDILKSYESILLVKNNIEPTILGKASSSLYFYPSKIYQWMCNFDSIFNLAEQPNTFAVAWALSNVSCNSNRFVPRESKAVVEDFSWQVSSYGSLDSNGCRVGACWWWLLGGPSLKSLKHEALELKKEWKRIFKALKIINSYKKWEKASFLQDLDVRVKNRVPEELIELCRIGFNKSCAAELYNTYSISSLQEVYDRRSEVLSSCDNESVLESIGRILHEHRDKLSRESIQDMFGVNEER